TTLFRGSPHHRRVDASRRDCVDGDPHTPELARERLGEAVKTGGGTYVEPERQRRRSTVMATRPLMAANADLRPQPRRAGAREWCLRRDERLPLRPRCGVSCPPWKASSTSTPPRSG